MNIEIAGFQEEYRQEIHKLVQEFHQESLDEYGIGFNPEALERAVDELKHSGWLLVIDGKPEGLIAGKEVYTPYSNDKVWHEVIWFVRREYRQYGMKLFKAAKELLKVRGYTAYVMVYMHNSKSDKLDRLYRKMGLTPMETNFIGRL